MTKKQAKQALKEGKKIAHESWPDFQWLKLYGEDKVIDNTGIGGPLSNFINRYFIEPRYLEGWSIYQG